MLLILKTELILIRKLIKKYNYLTKRKRARYILSKRESSALPNISSLFLILYFTIYTSIRYFPLYPHSTHFH